MNKTQILMKNTTEPDNTVLHHNKGIVYNEAVNKSMDEYAEQEVISFLKWRDNKKGNPQDGSVWWWGLSEKQQFDIYTHEKTSL